MARLEAERLARRNEALFEGEDAPACAQTGFQLVRVKGLAHVIIRSSFDPFNDLFFLIFRAKNNNVDITLRVSLSQCATDLNAVYLGHHPIQDGQPWPVFGLKRLQSRPPVARRHHIKTPLFQEGFEDAERNRVVFGD